MNDKIKNGLIVALVVVIVLGGIFGGRAVKRFKNEVTALKTANTLLNDQMAVRDKQIASQNDTIASKEVTIAKLMAIFKLKDKQISALTQERDVAIAQLEGVTSDSLYQALQEICYVYAGQLQYPFNASQIKAIYTDYITARSSEKVIPALTSQLQNAKTQFIERDKLVASLRGVVALQDQNLTDCKQINKNSDKVIKDTERQRDKEKRRKNFWRFGTGVATATAIILTVFVK